MKSKKRLLTAVLLLAALALGAVWLMAERSTLLNKAVWHCSPLSVRLLTALGADVNVENALAHLRFPDDRKEACMEVARLLIASGADVDADDHNGNLLADAVDDPDFAKLLIESGADVNLMSQKRLGMWENMTPLLHAVNLLETQSVRLLIDAGADVNLMGINHDIDECRGVKGWSMTPLMRNLRYAMLLPKNVEIEKMLIDAGADLNVQNPCGYTALMYAAEKDFFKLLALSERREDPSEAKKAADVYNELIQMLIQAGANLNLTDKDGESALMKAVFWERREAAKMLIEAGADVNLADKDGKTALMIASGREDVEIVEALIKAGADLHAVDQNHQTALDDAALKGRLDVVKALIAAGADVKPACGSPMLQASKEGQIEVLKALIEAGADVNARDCQNEKTPLMLASEEGNLDLVKILLASGADVNAKDKDSQSALNGDLLKIQAMLKTAGAQ